MSTLLRSATQAQVDELTRTPSETLGRRVRYLSDPSNLSEKKNGTIVSRMEHSVDQANPVVVRNTNFHPAGDARLGGALMRAIPYATIHARALQNDGPSMGRSRNSAETSLRYAGTAASNRIVFPVTGCTNSRRKACKACRAKTIGRSVSGPKTYRLSPTSVCPRRRACRRI